MCFCKALKHYFNNLQKIGEFAKIQIFIAKYNYLKQKMCKKKSRKLKQIYIPQKPLTQQIPMCKNACKILKT